MNPTYKDAVTAPVGVWARNFELKPWRLDAGDRIREVPELRGGGDE